MEMATAWLTLEGILKFGETGEGLDAALLEWQQVSVGPELQEAVKFLATNGMSDFLQEWLLETIFQDLNKRIKPAFWGRFPTDATDSDRNEASVSQAIDFLYNIFSERYMVAVRRLRWLQMLASSGPALAGCPQSAFTPVKTGANKPTKGLQFDPALGLSKADKNGRGEGGQGLSVTFEEGTKGLSRSEYVDESLEGISFNKNMDGSYMNEKQFAERPLWSDSSHSMSTSHLNISEMNLSKNNAQTEEEEDTDYFIRSPIGGYKQQKVNETPENPNIGYSFQKLTVADTHLKLKESLLSSKSSQITSTSTPWNAPTHHTPGLITPIVFSDSPDIFDNLMEARSGEETSEETMSVQESSSKETGDQQGEVLPSVANVFGVPAMSRPVPGSSVHWMGSNLPISHAVIKLKVTVMMKAVLFSYMPPYFIKAVKDFYTKAFKAHRSSMENSDVGEESEQTQKINTETNMKLDEMGLMELVSDWAVTEIVHTQIEQHIQEECEKSFDTPFLAELEEWLDQHPLGWLRQLYIGRQTASQLTWMDAFRDRLRHFVYETYAKSLISQFFDIIIDYPESKPAIVDLTECLQKTDLRSELVSSLKSALENRLLHPGVNTGDILTAYIAAIKALRLLEPAGVILELVCEPVSRYLRSREDTVRCIVASLTDEGNNELVNELVKSKPPGEEEEEEDNNANWEEWMPDPVDADPSAASKSRRSADILTTLVNIYGSKELCFNEYRALLADRILSHYHCDVERELRYLELLKLRFGEAPLHFCEVMLRDVIESRRVNSRVQDSRKATKGPDDVEMNAVILSAQFWPAFRDEKVKLPQELQEHLDKFTKDFQVQKANRTLVWKPHLGTMNIELELKDETLNFSVSPVQAAIIMKFQTKTKWSVDELCTELEMTSNSLRRKIAYWQSQGILREISADVYQLVEERRGRPHDLIMVDEEETESAMASAQQQKEEEMQVFWTYIQGMLANLHCLSLERIHSMLRMFAMEEPGSSEVTPQELKTFLDNKVKNQLLVFSEGVYRLNK